MRFSFTLTGETSLLMHWDSVLLADEVSAWRLDPANEKKQGEKSGDDRRPVWTWLTYLYHDGSNIVVPAANLARCLTTGGARVTLKGNKTFKELAAAGLFLESEYAEFRGGATEPAVIPVTPLLELRDEPTFSKHVEAVRRSGFELDIRRAKVGASKHVRVRPRFKLWEVAGTLEVTDSRITPEILDQIFAQAGRAGLGDWRPSSPKSPGPYGMFGHQLKRLK